MNNIISSRPLAALKAGNGPPPPGALGGNGRSAPPEEFRAVLERTLTESEPVRFSLHARERIESRQVDLGAQDVRRINQAVEHAAAKGAQQALLLADRYALIVNIPQRVVITAMNRGQMSDHVFTNIDSTVIINPREPVPHGGSSVDPLTV